LPVRRSPRGPLLPPGSATRPRALVVESLRGPYGLRGGALAGWHPVDLSAELMEKLLSVARLPGSSLKDVIWGCTSQVGAQAANVARRSVLAAGWPERIPGLTIDNHACSSSRALNLAAQAALTGGGLLLAGGVEVTSAVPLGAPLAQPGIGKPYGLRLTARYKEEGGLGPPGLVAEEVCRRWSFTRAELDAWARESLGRAQSAQEPPPGYVLPLQRLRPSSAAEAAVAPVRGRRPKQAELLERDEALEGKRRKADISGLPAAYLHGGVITAGNMAAEGDGAAAVLVAGAGAAAELGVACKAAIAGFAVGATSPAIWPLAAVPASLAALDDAGLRVADIDRWYVYESSAAAVLAWSKEMDVPLDVVNPNGGALASTSPVGAVGAGLVAEAVAGLAKGRNGTALVCTAGEGGVGAACVLGPPS